MGGTKVHKIISILNNINRMLLSSFSLQSICIYLRLLLPLQHHQSYTNTILTFKEAHKYNH